MRSARLAAFALLLALPAQSRADSPFYLKDGDRVVFYGDSITDQRLYTTFVETYAVTRFPRLNLSFVHSGWGGDRVITLAHEGETNARRTIGIARFEWDTEVDAREAQAALEHAVDDMMIGSFEQTMDRTRWWTLEGTTSWVERRDKAVVIVLGAPMQLAAAAQAKRLRGAIDGGMPALRA